MYKVWSINIRNNKILWLMGEYPNVTDAMKKAELVVLDANPEVDEVSFERSEVTEKATQQSHRSLICYSPNEVVGSVITGPGLDLDQVSQLIP
jgi:hypothetical protein